MAASRQDIVRKLRGLEDEMDRLFDHFLLSRSYLGMLSESVWHPPTDVYETENAVMVVMEIPGVESEEVDITWHDSVLHISGRRADRCKDTKVCVHLMEINYGHFHRTIETGFALEDGSIEDARITSGFLRIRIAKPREH
jgi:HSP20 family protein